MTLSLGSPLPVSGTLCSPTSDISFVIVSSVANIDMAQTNVWVESQLAILGGVIQPEFAGSIILGINQASIVITTHPSFTHRNVDVVILTKDLLNPFEWLEYVITPELPGVRELRAKTWPEGKRIDLIFLVPNGVQQVRIRRSKLSYSSFPEDPGDDIYIGTPTNLDTTPITRFYDGNVIDPVYRSSGSFLEENCFYYYTIFVTYSRTFPEVWLTDPESRVQGLSIKDYHASEGDWVYKLLPLTYRQRDADPNRGSDQYKLLDFCKVIQAYASLQRGWQEALLMLRDPELMPAGRLDENQNQTGLLAAQVWDLGANPERSYDAGVLRRLAAGIVSVYQAKGTCPGLVNYVKLLTGWDSRCDEQVEPVCAIDRLFQLHDEESYILLASGTAGSSPADVWVYQFGELFVPPGGMTEADGVTPATAPLTSDEVPTVGAIIDALGTFVCVSEVQNVIGGQRFLFTEPHARLRAEMTGVGLAGPPTERRFTITLIDFTSPQGGWPWQFPTEEPIFMTNALKGLKLLDSANVLHTIESSSETAFGQTEVVVENGTGDPIAGSYSIAWNITPGASFADRTVHWRGRFLVGSHSFLVDPVWDVRLLEENVPSYWSFLIGFGSSLGVLGYTATPADVTIWVADQHEEIGKVSSITQNSITIPEVSWTTDQWVNYYVIPNWNQNKSFRIVHNTNDTLVVSTFPSMQGLFGVTDTDRTYVILDELNRVKYHQLINSLPSYLPYDVRGIVKFENFFEPSSVTGFLSEYRADRGVKTDQLGGVNAWHDFGPFAAVAEQTVAGNRPLYIPSDFDGLPSIEFDGTDDYLTLATALGSLGLGAGGSFTIVALYRATSGWVMAHGNVMNAGPDVSLRALGPGTTTYVSDDFGSSVGLDHTEGSSGDWDFVVFRFAGLSKLVTVVNGISQDGVGSLDTTVTVDFATIGAYYSAGTISNYLTGKIRHLVIYGEYISDADVEKVIEYIHKQWPGS